MKLEQVYRRRGKHFLRKKNGWRHALDRIATAKKETLAGGATESRVDGESTAGLGGARVNDDLLWDDLANI